MKKGGAGDARRHLGGDEGRGARVGVKRRATRVRDVEEERRWGVAEEISELWREEQFDEGAAARVRVLARRHPRSAYVQLAVAEYFDLRSVHLYFQNPDWQKLRARKLDWIVRLYRKAVELMPECARAWEGLAAVLDIDCQFAEAEKAARQAVRWGDDPDSVALLARIVAQRGKREEALELASDPRVVEGRSEWAKSVADEVREGVWFKEEPMPDDVEEQG